MAAMSEWMKEKVIRLTSKPIAPLIRLPRKNAAVVTAFQKVNASTALKPGSRLLPRSLVQSSSEPTSISSSCIQAVTALMRQDTRPWRHSISSGGDYAGASDALRMAGRQAGNIIGLAATKVPRCSPPAWTSGPSLAGRTDTHGWITAAL